MKEEKIVSDRSERNPIRDYFALTVSTFGVGYLPLAPGTWGSMVGILIFLAYRKLTGGAKLFFLDQGWVDQPYSAFFFSAAGVLLIAFCFLGIWASRRTEKIHGKRDSQKIVVDEIIGQLIVFAFVPLSISRWLIVTGFVLFRIFDIWKPYPAKAAEGLPNGIGVCADDIVAGIYGGVCLSIIYLISLSF